MVGPQLFAPAFPLLPSLLVLLVSDYSKVHFYPFECSGHHVYHIL